jgi:hypothetical protein
MFTDVKNILKTFELDNHVMLRTSQPEKSLTGPYEKKECIANFVTEGPEIRGLFLARSWVRITSNYNFIAASSWLAWFYHYHKAEPILIPQSTDPK